MTDWHPKGGVASFLLLGAAGEFIVGRKEEQPGSLGD